tara:strand:+ start:175 stop:396 length:222 start_codon:yes stop_codon:yes gene_type:complete
MNEPRFKNFSTLPGFAFKKEDTYVISKNYYDNSNDKLINDDIYIKLLKNIMIDSKKKIKTNKLKKKNKNTRKK